MPTRKVRSSWPGATTSPPSNGRQFLKVAKHCIWAIIEGGEPTSRPDFMEIVKYLHGIKMPVTLITNCSLLHAIDLDELKKHIQFVTCSIDSTFEEPYYKVRAVMPQMYRRVMDNLRLLSKPTCPTISTA